MRKVVYAASSTYYGNQAVPFTETDPFMPTSPYAASKYMGELVMLTNDNLYKLPTLKPEIAERSEGDFLVIFTLIYQVYQPWGISSDYFLFVQGPFSNQGTCASLWSTALATPRRAPMPSSRGSSSIG